MAVRPILIRRPPPAVWAVLCDGSRFADWVVGTHDSAPLDDDWPAVGSAIRYVVRLGPLRARGRTVVRFHEPGRRIELEAQSRSAGTARIAIEVRPWGRDTTLVTVDEHPLTGVIRHLHNPLFEAVLQLRHRLMLRNLARVVESSVEAPGGSR
ncbi:SRPBCC family protein [Streptomyces sp. PT12]|uniref:SRPBCC family protein n=1 Tax=Streptomyces sp. PT12 TaxID=1510197 RepID=UPI000DE4A68B|nr:SRPBCC family protein [Streptomyces sp. PT12]RBM16118.1 polyketide cyclase [Streptomyces sp. PT12]